MILNRAPSLVLTLLLLILQSAGAWAQEQPPPETTEPVEEAAAEQSEGEEPAEPEAPPAEDDAGAQPPAGEESAPANAGPETAPEVEAAAPAVARTETAQPPTADTGAQPLVLVGPLPQAQTVGPQSPNGGAAGQVDAAAAPQVQPGQYVLHNGNIYRATPLTTAQAEATTGGAPTRFLLPSGEVVEVLPSAQPQVRPQTEQGTVVNSQGEVTGRIINGQFFPNAQPGPATQGGASANPAAGAVQPGAGGVMPTNPLTGSPLPNQAAPFETNPAAASAIIASQPQLPSRADLETRISALQLRADIDEATKTEAIGVLQDALNHLQSLEEQQQKGSGFKTLRTTAPEVLSSLQQDFQALREAEPVEIPQTLTRQEAEQRLTAINTQLREAEQELEKLTTESATRKTRRATIPDLLVEAKKQLAEREEELRTLGEPTEGEPARYARGLRLKLQIASLKNRIIALEEELASYDARSELLTARLDYAKAKISRAKRQATALDAIIEARRTAEIAQQREEARTQQEELAKKHPVLVEAAARNTELTELRSVYTADLKDAKVSLASTSKRLKTVTTKYENFLAKYSAGALRESGPQLIDEYERLPSLRELRLRREAIRNNIREAELLLYEIEEERSQLADIDGYIDDVIEGLQLNNRDRGDRIRQDLETILQTRRDYLDNLQKDVSDYVDTLTQHETELLNLIDTVQTFRDFAQSNILWIPNMDPISLSDAKSLQEAVEWGTIELLPRLERMRQNIVRKKEWAVLFSGIAIVLLVTGLLICRRNQRAVVDRRVFSRSLKPTLRELGWLFAWAAIPAAIIFLLSWVIHIGAKANPGQFDQAVVAGFQSIAIIILTTGVLIEMCRKDGIAQTHFRWHRDRVRRIRQNLRWGVPILVPLLFLMTFVYELREAADIVPGGSGPEGEGNWRLNVARLLFIFLMLILGGLMGTIFNIKNGVFTVGKKTFWTNNTFVQWVVYILSFGLPVGFAIMAAMGFFYAAHELSLRFLETVWLTLALIIINGVIGRWIRITKLKLIEEKEADRLIKEHGEKHKDEPDSATQREVVLEQIQRKIEDEESDYANIDRSIMQLMKVCLIAAVGIGLWLIWNEVLPALRKVGEVELYKYNDGTENIRLVELVLALLYGFIAFIASRNLPNLIDFLLLRRINMTAGGRYTATSLFTYVIVAIGGVITLNSLGLQWSNIQWLVAAISVGLGFGLQEIFGNFISGLILLFERPIRVGDIVTVGNTTGVVSKIRIRGTTVVDFDKKELIVPNKEFVTGQLINWSLTDSTSRLKLAVGVAYGTDLEKAQQIILSVIESRTDILKDPPPRVFLEGFADSSINFMVFIFLPNLDNRLLIQTEVYVGIDKAFRKNGISIPFPQRDLHIRSMDPEVEHALLTRFSGNGRGNGHAAEGPGEQEESPSRLSEESTAEEERTEASANRLSETEKKEGK